MIHTISRYMYEIHRDRNYFELCEARRKAFKLFIAIFAVVAIGVFAYLLQ